MVRRWRRLRYWARQKRVVLWAILLAGLLGLGYALAVLTGAGERYAPSYYEPKDIERQKHLEGGTGAR
jgi:hypothetical protein